jgi:hypothetical protein
LQLEGDGKSNGGIARTFALGDVAETGGPRMARAGMMQAEIMRENTVVLIKRKKLAEYTSLALEGALKLSLGKVEDIPKSNLRRRNLIRVCR